MHPALRLLELQRVTAEHGTWPRVAEAIERFFKTNARALSRKQLIDVYEKANT